VILTDQQRARAAELAEKFDVAALVYNIATLEKLRWAVKNSDTSRALLEASLLRFALSEHFLNVDQLLSQIKPGSTAPVKKKVQRAVDSPSTPPPKVTSTEKQSVNREQQIAEKESQETVGSSNIQSMKDNWQETLELIKNELGPGTSALLSSAVPSRFENGVLTLEFGPSAQTRMSAINGRIDQIESLLSKQFSGFLKLKFETAKHEQIGTLASPTQTKTITQKRTELLNDPAVKTVLLGLDATVTRIEED
jgi:DNA polymerase-3 subunit gamma/tau